MSGEVGAFGEVVLSQVKENVFVKRSMTTTRGWLCRLRGLWHLHLGWPSRGYRKGALRLGAVGAEAGGVSVVLLEEKSRLMVVRPERGCRSGCITSGDDERNVQDTATVTIQFTH